MSKRIGVRGLVEQLAAAFPAAFVMPEGRRRPLKIGIFDDIRARGLGLSARDITYALHYYTRNPGYQRALWRGDGVRVDLDGNPAGSVTAEEREHAHEWLLAYAEKYAARQRQASNPRPAPDPQAVNNDAVPVAPAPKQRLGLADLRAAAKLRRGSR